jgi:HSP20 family protein
LAQPKKESKDVAVRKKELATPSPRQRTMSLAPRQYTELDRVFERFRRDFEDLLWPSERSLTRAFSMLPAVQIRVPHVDLEDRGKDFLLRAEMPGFRSSDIDVHVQGDAIEIQATAGWKYDDRTKRYICKERECESFYRMVELPEEIKTDKVEAELKDGILEVVLPKKAPKQKRKVNVK